MTDKKNYNMATNADGIIHFCASIEWQDTNNELNAIHTTDMDTARIILELLSGEICLEDLKP